MSRRQKAPAPSTRRRRPRRAALRSADGAKRSALTSFPGFIEPCHPTERDGPPSGDPWVQEIKADGYRAQGACARRQGRGHDWTQTFASIARTAAYHALRRELARKGAGNLTYYVFDLLYLDGEDLRPRPLSERKSKLKALVAKVPHGFLYADHLEADRGMATLDDRALVRRGGPAPAEDAALVDRVQRVDEDEGARRSRSATPARSPWPAPRS